MYKVLRSISLVFCFLCLSCTALYCQAPSKGAKDNSEDDEYKKYFSLEYLANDKQKEAIIKRVYRREPFVGSYAHRGKEYVGSIGHFLTTAEYHKLRGNPVIGFWDFGAFAWPSDWKEIEIVPFKATSGPGAQVIGEKAWVSAAKIVCQNQGLIQKPGAKIKVTGVTVGIQKEPPGVMIEARVKSPTGTLIYRGGTAKRTMGDAVGGTLDFLINLARVQNGQAR
jgi:hypothetical protein